jgi:hypothetical protein
MNDIIDVIILSNTANLTYFRLLKKCIDSIKKSANIDTVIEKWNKYIK